MRQQCQPARSALRPGASPEAGRLRARRAHGERLPGMRLGASGVSWLVIIILVLSVIWLFMRGRT
jgi:hypothetical protein